jgi:hypothetical protein
MSHENPAMDRVSATLNKEASSRLTRLMFLELVLCVIR